MLMMIKDAYEAAKNIWPAEEPLDTFAEELVEVPEGAVNIEDIQRLVDWLTRVRRSYPELYVSQKDSMGKK